MLKAAILKPDLILGDTVLALTPEILQQYQLKGLVLDIDETLVPLRQKEPSEELREWMEPVRKVASIWLASNNLSVNRISSIAQSLDLPYILGARKPSRRKLRSAITAMNLPVERVAMVGDHLFTDILAGNRLGMFTILVEPMVGQDISPSAHPIRDFEIWLSQLLGVSLKPSQQKEKSRNESPNPGGQNWHFQSNH
ncbi:MAG: YqeG family HAD IIIA-type phosphatase [Prochloron sp. SP5CPC1]|nr:YqeG family HAD IIIA-type phosphatase [Candidatus Paraprochloron terpiosi SP5CPC1]